ncbi:MAG: apolipoprotein N-acyltransferase [Acidobacteria bacterium]|nr:apolipoprotein N-acyltransferase [Acidobacteriota bacterium]
MTADGAGIEGPESASTALRRAAWQAAAGGGLFGLCWLPFGLAPLIPLAFLLMMLGLQGARTTRQALWLGALCEAIRYVVGAHFLLALLAYSPLAAVFYLATIVYIVPMGMLSWWGAFQLERWTGLPRPVGLALGYTLFEKLRSVGDLSFPADLTDHAFGTNPSFLAWSDWIGPFGVTLTMCGVALLALRAIDAKPRRRAALAWGAAALALWAGAPLTGLLAGRAAERGSEGARFRVGIVQPATPVADKLDPARAPLVWDELKRLTLEAAPGADLVLWPETARPGYLFLREGEPPRDPEVAAIARAAGVPILYGAHLAEVEGGEAVALYNGAALVRADGSFGGWYGKQRLLPLAEGVPFGRLLGLDPRQRARDGQHRGYLTLIGNFTPGPEPTIFEVGPARIGVLICYEGMYAQLARTYRQRGANVLAVLTNDLWWGHSTFAPWHARMIASRAVEEAMPAVRAANSGVSSVTDGRGASGPRTGLDEIRTLTVELTPGPAGSGTFYTRYGDWVLWILPLAPLAAWAASRVRRRAS